MRKNISQFPGTQNRTFRKANFEKRSQHQSNSSPLPLILFNDLLVTKINKLLSYYKNYTHHIVGRLL